MVNGITVPQPCGERWINKLVRALEGVDIWVDPRQWRVSNLFHDETNIFISKVLANVYGKILDSREYLRPLNNPWEGVNWDHRVSELNVDVGQQVKAIRQLLDHVH